MQFRVPSGSESAIEGRDTLFVPTVSAHEGFAPKAFGQWQSWRHRAVGDSRLVDLSGDILGSASTGIKSAGRNPNAILGY